MHSLSSKKNAGVCLFSGNKSNRKSIIFKSLLEMKEKTDYSIIKIKASLKQEVYTVTKNIFNFQSILKEKVKKFKIAD